MKERPIQVSSFVLFVTAALFAGFTWDRWGILVVAPGLRGLVLGSALFALGVSLLFVLTRSLLTRPQPRPLATPHRNFVAVKSKTISISVPGRGSRNRKQPVRSSSFVYRRVAKLK